MSEWLSIRKDPSTRLKSILAVASFLIPILIWSALSYIPALWHPMAKITYSGDSYMLQKGQVVAIEDFTLEYNRMIAEGAPVATLPNMVPSNPVYFPAPHEVAKACYTAFTTQPKRRGEPWLHESLQHSVSIVFLAFFYSSLMGIPLGILAGTFGFFSRLIEPFVEFFRYLPAPAFGALAVAILGINDAPKIAIIVIGTLFQQILVIANTVRSVDRSLIEAAQTLGANTLQLIFRIIIPSVLPRLFKDLRILLGWAWTYLIVAEVVGASSGITWFINQQAKYRIYENVYAAIIIIGVIGLTTDLILSFISKNIFPWEEGPQSKAMQRFKRFNQWFWRDSETLFYKHEQQKIKNSVGTP